MRKPLFVLVYWSESSKFKENELFSFVEFESKAWEASVEVMEGYDKTLVKILFDDGSTHECRIDLSPREDRGFKSYVISAIKWYEMLTDEDRESYSAGSFKPKYEFFKQIAW